jgi:3-dehydroquinate synthase class II
VSPLVAYLAHEQCSVNGHVYSVAGGRIARIFVAETHGVVLTTNTAEQVQASLSVIDEMDVERYHQPSSLDEETMIIAKALSEAS